MSRPPPPELLEQLGIEPHCTCTGHDERHIADRAGAPPYVDPARGPQHVTDATTKKENAMRDIATATLSGNLTRDVELRELPSGADWLKELLSICK